MKLYPENLFLTETEEGEKCLMILMLALKLATVAQ